MDIRSVAVRLFRGVAIAAACTLPGMALLADGLQKHFPELEVRFFPCGDLISYAE